VTSSGHVTSSGACAIDSPYGSFYRLYIVTIPLSGLVSEIFSPKVADRTTERMNDRQTDTHEPTTRVAKLSVRKPKISNGICATDYPIHSMFGYKVCFFFESADRMALFQVGPNLIGRPRPM